MLITFYFSQNIKYIKGETVSPLSFKGKLKIIFTVLYNVSTGNKYQSMGIVLKKGYLLV